MSSRFIYRLPTASPSYVQVLALGMSKTGTMSIKTALDHIGYKTLHASTVQLNPGYVYWNEALDTKPYGRVKPYAEPESDKLLIKCTAITDMPAIMLVDKLLAACPEAKVVLTNPNIDSWLKSFNNSVYVMMK